MAFDTRLCPNSANNPPWLNLVDVDMVSTLSVNPSGLLELVKLCVRPSSTWRSFLNSSPSRQDDCTNLHDPTQNSLFTTSALMQGPGTEDS